MFDKNLPGCCRSGTNTESGTGPRAGGDGQDLGGSGVTAALVAANQDHRWELSRMSAAAAAGET